MFPTHTPPALAPLPRRLNDNIGALRAGRQVQAALQTALAQQLAPALQSALQTVIQAALPPGLFAALQATLDAAGGLYPAAQAAAGAAAAEAAGGEAAEAADASEVAAGTAAAMVNAGAAAAAEVVGAEAPPADAGMDEMEQAAAEAVAAVMEGLLEPLAAAVEFGLAPLGHQRPMVSPTKPPEPRLNATLGRAHGPRQEGRFSLLASSSLLLNPPPPGPASACCPNPARVCIKVGSHTATSTSQSRKRSEARV